MASLRPLLREPGARARNRGFVSCRGRDGQLNFRPEIDLAPDFQASAHKFGPLMHSQQTPVSCAALVRYNLGVHAFLVIANSHAEPPLAVVYRYFDSSGMGHHRNEATRIP